MSVQSGSATAAAIGWLDHGGHDQVRRYASKRRWEQATFIPLDGDLAQGVDADVRHIWVDFPNRSGSASRRMSLANHYKYNPLACIPARGTEKHW